MIRQTICSLQKQMSILPGRVKDWNLLSQYHYRQDHPGVIDKVFTMTFHPKRHILLPNEDKVIGVIVYAMPLANCAYRNRATNQRYFSLGSRSETLSLLNREVRRITRVVIHPQFRGIGLAHWLVSETLPKAGVPLVEAMATMGHLNPFFEKAGMLRFDQEDSVASRRLIDAFAHININVTSLSQETLVSQIKKCPEHEQYFIKSEMMEMIKGFSRRFRQLEPTLENLTNFVVRQLKLRPVYYLWQRSDSTLYEKKLTQENQHENSKNTTKQTRGSSTE